LALIEALALSPPSIYEAYHPAILNGRRSSHRTPIAFGQQVWRHAALGIVLGWLTPKRK
jgi:hypothetical protein